MDNKHEKLEGIGNGIRVARTRKRMTQSDLAKLVGVSEPVVSKWENGKRQMSVLQFLEIRKFIDLEIEIKALQDAFII